MRVDHGVLLPFPVSHHSGPKVCLDMPFPAPFSPATPATCLQKNHSSFKSHTSRDLWKDAAICFVDVTVNTDYNAKNARFLQWIKSISAAEASAYQSQILVQGNKCQQLFFGFPPVTAPGLFIM